MRQRATGETGGSRLAVWPLAAAALVGLSACGLRPSPELPAPAQFTVEVRRMLGAEPWSENYLEALRRLREYGPEIDAVLVALARDPNAKTTARANALLLLAERDSPAAIPELRRALLTEEIPQIRATAVLAAQRVSLRTDSAMGLIRSAITDPSRTVRLNALQALEVGDVERIRALLEIEPDREVRHVAVQLVALAENRGVPLAPDRRGALRTTGPETDPQIVFRAAQTDTVAGTASGDLRVELPNGPDVPLTPAAEVVGGVVPAFFSPDRSRVIFEAERRIHVVDLATREVRTLGPGLAPRPIPFSQQFVFVREIPGTRRETEAGTEIRYRVMRGWFGDPSIEPLGELTAVARMERHANYSPVRWMVVAEVPEGYALQGQGITPFVLPATVWGARPGEPAEPAPR